MPVIRTRFKFLIFLLLSSVCSFPAFAQRELPEKFNEYQQNVIQEKVFVHTDKNLYQPGETLWFKLYDVDGMLHQPFDLSKAAYVEIIDKEKNSLLHTRIKLHQGIGHGSFPIPQLNSGNYVLRAYTRWMKNFSEEYYFEKPIFVVNPHSGLLKDSTIQKQVDVRIAFFPEGGDLVRSLTSKVGFRACGKNGKGIDINGVITDENGETVAGFQSLKFGIGSFVFTPLSGHTYKAVVTHNGITSRHEIPRIKDEGYVMTLNDLSAEKLHVVVTRHSESTSPESVSLFVHTRQHAKVAVVSVLKDKIAGFLIDKNKLGDGISHITIFNGNRQPVCERLYFSRPKNILVPIVKTEKDHFATRQKVSLDILTTDKEKVPVVSSMSLSVYRADSLQPKDPDNILTYFQLTSDLTGYVESPNYYLSTNDSLAKLAVDNLMLTHGWRRFNWQDVLNDKLQAIRFTPEYEGVVVSGRIADHGTQAPSSNTTMYLSIPGARPQFYTARSNSNGEFEFYLKDPAGQNEIVIQPPSDIGKYSITIDNPYSEKFSDRTFPPVTRPIQLNAALRTISIHAQAENYFKKGKDIFSSHQPDTMPFYKSPDKTYMLSDYVRFSTIEEVLREYVPEVMVRRQEKRSSLFVLNKKAQDFFTEQPLILFDGIPIPDDGRIASTNVQHVKKLEVITNRYWLGPAMFNGIVNFTTYKGDLAGLELDPNTFVLNFEGLQLQREFYAPHYETTDQLKSRIPDFRNVLIWSPDIVTDTAGKSNVSFYTSDEKGTYVGILHGISQEGLMGTAVFTIKVGDQ